MFKLLNFLTTCTISRILTILIVNTSQIRIKIEKKNTPFDSDISITINLIPKPFTVLFYYLNLETIERHLDFPIPQNSVSRGNAGIRIRQSTILSYIGIRNPWSDFFTNEHCS